MSPRRRSPRSALALLTRLPANPSGRPIDPFLRTRKAFARVRRPLFGSTALGTKLYVGNLSFQTSGSDLEQLFAEFGEVQSAQVVEDRETGRSRGFGFVEMGTAAAAQAAIDALNDKEYQGRRLTVNEAKPMLPRDNNRGSGGFGGGNQGNRY